MKCRGKASCFRADRRKERDALRDDDMKESFYADRKGSVTNEGVQEYHYAQKSFYIDGLIYAYGKKAGKETVDWICREMEDGNGVPYEELRGAYSCMIRSAGETIAFSDNSNMHCIYYSGHYVSNSFLRLLCLEKDAGSDLSFDNEALCEYLSLGGVYFDKTFFSDIRILPSTKAVIVRSGAVSVVSKGIGGIDRKSGIEDLSDFFARLSYSISDDNVCQALTGGYDSRLVYACLSSKVSDHPAISSNDKSNRDVRCAAEAAAANGDELEIIPIPKPEYHDELVASFLRASDGIQPLDIDSFVRLSAFRRALSGRYTVLLTGDGGVLHKDWEWTQDLPFYRKKRSDPGKFYRQRLCYVDYSRFLGDAVSESYAGQEKRFVSELEKLSKSINTQSYDSWYYDVSGNRRTYYNHTMDSGLTMYAPLMELDTVRYSYALPRHKRFFYHSMRDTVSRENRALARLKTNYGTTASNEFLFLARDVFFQIGEYGRKAFRLIGRKVLNKNVLVKSQTGWSLENEIRNSAAAENALIYAKEKGLIKKEAKAGEISYELLTRIIHIHWLAREKEHA